ncbi:hypothetical protein [Maledivibacter halophilus]|uniref:Bacteriophage lambda head decoration protein D n=1 Tax=Maledivibacter halophilus TaxID=36842 RepID=A0A1T5L3D3_9FIRM|nr:hypothetical protein [Maledivibacter halophilus]SKC70453.1 hypothetical protein SAMN02194393_02441 [Maledivibacter halophilus]
MSYERSTTIFGKEKTILELAEELFQNTTVKVKASDVPIENGKRILKAGTILSKEGKKVNDSSAYGVVYRDVNLTYSNVTETVLVTIFGFVKEAALPVAPSAEAKAAMKMIMFV